MRLSSIQITLVSCLLFSSSLSFTSPVLASSDLLSETQQAHRDSIIADENREAQFKKTVIEKERKLIQLQKKLQQLEQEVKRNKTSLAIDRRILSELVENQKGRVGELEEVFNDVQVKSVSLLTMLSNSPSLIGADHSIQLLQRLSNPTHYPSMAELSSLYQFYVSQLMLTKNISKVSLDVFDDDGKLSQLPAWQIGNFSLLNEERYFHFNSENQTAQVGAMRMDAFDSPTLTEYLLSTSFADSIKFKELPRHEIGGIAFQQIQDRPVWSEILLGDNTNNKPFPQTRWLERFEKAGIVGKLLIVLLIAGLSISLYRGVVLFRLRQQIRQSMSLWQNNKNLAEIQKQDHAFSRILSVYQADKNHSLSALELRLLDAVVKEQTGIDNGLSSIKLFAAIAPMLGLLGTIVGMIDTFNSIEQIGKGDPQLMASGISMALITTVLGLVTAIPLLFCHNMLRSQADWIHAALEKIGIALLAEHEDVNQLSSTVIVDKRLPSTSSSIKISVPKQEDTERLKDKCE